MEKIKILLFTADPRSVRRVNKPRLELDAEVREIRKRVKTARRHIELDIDEHWATRPDDLVGALSETHPRVVHFSGHCGPAGLVLVGADASREHSVDASALAQLFEAYRGDIRLVVLNACLSLPQAEAIASVVGCAIGTGDEIRDDAAICFSSAFYRAIAFGDSVQVAFDRARAALALDHPDQRDCPQLVVRPGVDARKVFVLDPERVSTAEPTRVRMRVGVTAGLAGAVLVAAALSRGGEWKEACTRAGVRGEPTTPSALLEAGTSGVGSVFEQAKLDYTGGRYVAAFPRFRDFAGSGNPEAMGYVGAMFLRGQGIAARPDSGIHWLRQAAYRGDPKAMTALGDAYQHGEGVKISLVRAREWYQKAADRKNWPEAMRSLGMLDLGEQDHGQALAWFRNAVNAGSIEARVDAGLLYEQGQGTAADPQVAHCLYRTAAEAGSLRGMLVMGRSYGDGVGVARDYDEAAKWYRTAAGRGSPEAMRALGELYLNGLGVRRDTAQATSWIRKARIAGSSD